MEFFVLRRVFPDIGGINTRGFGILALIPIAFFLFVMTLALYPVHYTHNPAFPLLFFLSGAVIAIIYYAVFQYLRTQYQYQMDEQNREILELQIQGIKKHVEETDSPPPPEQVMELAHAPSWLSVKSIMPFMIFPQRAAGLSS